MIICDCARDCITLVCTTHLKERGRKRHAGETKYGDYQIHEAGGVVEMVALEQVEAQHYAGGG